MQRNMQQMLLHFCCTKNGVQVSFPWTGFVGHRTFSNCMYNYHILPTIELIQCGNSSCSSKPTCTWYQCSSLVIGVKCGFNWPQRGSISVQVAVPVPQEKQTNFATRRQYGHSIIQGYWISKQPCRMQAVRSGYPTRLKKQITLPIGGSRIIRISVGISWRAIYSRSSHS
jgi:hypothetical protein